MDSFASQMKGFTEHLRTSIAERHKHLECVHAATQTVLEHAQGFMGQVRQDHHAMAADLRSSLAAHRNAQFERSRALRHQHREALRHTSEQLHQSLDNHQRKLRKDVTEMRHQFAEARNKLGDDLRGAARAWQQFTAER